MVTHPKKVIPDQTLNRFLAIYNRYEQLSRCGPPACSDTLVIPPLLCGIFVGVSIVVFRLSFPSLAFGLATAAKYND